MSLASPSVAPSFRVLPRPTAYLFFHSSSTSAHSSHLLLPSTPLLLLTVSWLRVLLHLLTLLLVPLALLLAPQACAPAVLLVAAALLLCWNTGMLIEAVYVLGAACRLATMVVSCV